MTQEKKLVELIEEANSNYNFEFSVGKIPKPRDEYIADFLLENGVIVPHFKVGDTIWIIDIMGAAIPEERKIIHVNIRVGSSGKRYYYDAILCGAKGIANCAFWEDEIGETVFITKEEADKALAERKANEE